MNRVLFALVLLLCGCSHAGETMTLRFVDEDGKPVADVQNRIDSDDFPKDLVLKSDKKGICTLNFPTVEAKNKSFHITIWHPDYVYLSCGFGAYGIDPIPTELTVHLERGRVISGVVVDEQGKPVKGATICLYYDRGYGYREQPEFAELRQEPTTDDEGRWWGWQIPTKTFCPLGLKVSAAGFAPQRIAFKQEDKSFQSLADRTHRTILSLPLKLTGKLVVEDGADLERTIIRVKGPDRPFFHLAELNVSKTGDFLLNDLTSGTYLLEIVPENHVPTVFATTLTADSLPIEIPLKHGKPIRFRVFDTEGQPISGIEMRCFSTMKPSPYSAFSVRKVIKATDDEGRTVWNNALDEPCTYSFYHNYYDNSDYLFTTTPDLTPREEEYPITMHRKISVRGNAVDAETKQAIPRFRANVVGWAKPQEGDDPSGWDWNNVVSVGHAAWPFVEGDISYTIEHWYCAAEHCRVCISAHGYELAVSEEFFLKDGDREFNFELKKAAKTEP